MDINDIKSLLAEGWFNGVCDDELLELIRVSQVRDYAKKDYFYLVGDVKDCIYCILDGRVRLSIVSKSGDDFLLAIWEKGICFGEGGLNQSFGMPLQAQAATDCSVLVIKNTDLERVIKSKETFYKNLVDGLVDRSRSLFELIEVLLFAPLEARVAARILHLADLYGQDSSQGTKVPMKLNQSDLANMAGGSRQRVNKIIVTWTQENILRKIEGHYIISDINRLKAISRTTN